jgi:MraZ protein
MAFSGTYEHTLDAKNRLTVPARFRDQLEDGATIAMGLDGCATIWPTRDYEAYVERALSRVNPISERARKLERFLGGGSDETALDAAGRIMVPSGILRYAGLSKDVVVVGTRQYLEVWDRGKWDEMESDLSGEAFALAETLEDF